jgi:hypothetical protein
MAATTHHAGSQIPARSMSQLDERDSRGENKPEPPTETDDAIRTAQRESFDRRPAGCP